MVGRIPPIRLYNQPVPHPISPTTSPDSAGGTPGASSETWTTRRLLEWMTGYLQSREIDAPRVVAEMLLAHVLECPRMRLYMEIDRPASPTERDRLRTLVARAARHEPVQYLVGETGFYLREFAVEPTTLIPQPSTESLVDYVLGCLGRREDEGEGDLQSDPLPGQSPVSPGDVDVDSAAVSGETGDCPLIADIGTGCGCIAVSLAAQLPGARVVATDIVPETLDLAAANARRHQVEDRIEFLAGDGTTPLAGYVDQAGRRFDVICSNPPYVPADEHDQMDECVRRHVPRTAWDGGPDGLDVIAPLIESSLDLLVPGGRLAVEIANRHREKVIELATSAGFEDVDVLKDCDGFDRVLVGLRPKA